MTSGQRSSIRSSSFGGLSKTEECKAMLLTPDTISGLSEGDSSKPCHMQMGESDAFNKYVIKLKKRAGSM